MNARYSLILSVLSTLWTGSVLAAGYPADPGRMLLAGAYSLDEVVSGVKRRYPDKVLSADTVDHNGRQVHRVRIINEKGRVRGLRFDGETGKPLKRRRR